MSALTSRPDGPRDGATEIDATIADDATAPASESDDAIPARVGRYEIVAEVGAGAMGRSIAPATPSSIASSLLR